MIKTFRRHRKTLVPLKSLKPKFANEPEQLSGQVDGMPASDLEERFIKAARKHPSVKQAIFRLTLGAPKGMPGWLELDVLMDTTLGYRAIEIDDMSFIHKGEGERQEALLKDMRRLESLKHYGINLSQVEHVPHTKLETQADANRWMQENI